MICVHAQIGVLLSPADLHSSRSILEDVFVLFAKTLNHLVIAFSIDMAKLAVINMKASRRL